MKKINIEVVDPYQEYFKFNKVYCEHNGVKIQSLVDILGYVDDLKDDTLVSCNFDYKLEKKMNRVRDIKRLLHEPHKLSCILYRLRGH